MSEGVYVSPSRTPGGPRRLRRPVMAVALAGGALALSGCSAEVADTWKRGGLPEPASNFGPKIVDLWVGSWIALIAVGAVTWGLMLWAVAVYRRRRDDEVPVQTRYNLPIETFYTIAPLLMIAVFFVFTARDQSDITELSAEEPDNVVSVVGFRWNWTFNYVNEDAYDIGTPTDLPTLYLPEGEKVRFKLTSPDVIHSFWVPAFLFKMDVIPGRLNQFELTPTKQGTFAGKCAELCGVDHARMLFWVKVVSPEEYAKHIRELKAKGQSGQLETDQINTDATDGQGRTRIGG
jgi:cytochrome c oxidase subunit II